VKQEDQDDEGALKDDGYDITKEDEIGKNEPKPVPTPVAKPIAKPVAKPAPPPKREQRKPAPAPLPKREPPPKVYVAIGPCLLFFFFFRGVTIADVWCASTVKRRW
jgi:hypothetical protein